MPGELDGAEGTAAVVRRTRRVVPPFQTAVLVLSREAAGPYYLPLGSLMLWNERGECVSLPHWEPGQLDGVLLRPPYRRSFWRVLHRAMKLSSCPGSCSFSIALGLQ